MQEKQKLEDEVTSLQTLMEDDRKEIAELRRQQQVNHLLPLLQLCRLYCLPMPFWKHIYTHAGKMVIHDNLSRIGSCLLKKILLGKLLMNTKKHNNFEYSRYVIIKYGF
jgi:hypothetical protein